MVSMGRLESPPFIRDTCSEQEDSNPCEPSPLTPSTIQAVNTMTDCGPSRTSNSDDAQGYLDYTSKVGFGLKLGYTESQVQTALVKLGPQADQNELLDELIKLGAITSSSNSSCINNSYSNTNNKTVGNRNKNNNIVTNSDDGALVTPPLGHRSSCLQSSSFDTTSKCTCISPHRSNCPVSAPSTSAVGNQSSSCAPNSLGTSVVPISLSSAFCEPCYLSSLRPIVIDGTNVAISHGKREFFSCKGIRICVDLFRSRGHREISVLVPMWRKEVSRPEAPISDQNILLELERENILVFTPSRSVNGQRINCHDDRFIIKLAAENGGIVVSNDKFQDLLTEYSTTNPNIEYQKVIRDRLLMYVFVNDLIMLPDDPLGRDGISLDKFLLREKGPCPHQSVELQSHSSGSTQPPACPYNKKCTYGNKCKYYHPERGNQPVRSITERLAEQARMHLDMKTRSMDADLIAERMKACHTASLPPSLHTSGGESGKRKTLIRTKSVIPSAHTVSQLQSAAFVGAAHDNSMPARANAPAHKYNLFPSGALAMAAPPLLHKNLPSSSKAFSSNSCAELFAFDSTHVNHQSSSSSHASDSVEHLNLGKRFSDPVKAASQDSVITCNSFSLSEQGSPDSAAIHVNHHQQQRHISSHHASLSSAHPVSTCHMTHSALHHHHPQLQSSHSLNSACGNSAASGNRQHRKLARQLTLNPYEQAPVFHSASPSTGFPLSRRNCGDAGDARDARDAFDSATCSINSHPMQAPIGSQRLHWSPGSVRAPIGCHRQHSLRRMRSEATDSSPSVSSCSSFSSCSSNAPHSVTSSALDCSSFSHQAREAVQSLAKDDNFNRLFGDLVVLAMGDDGSLDAELTVQNKHCNGHGSLHEAFAAGLVHTLSFLSFHIPLGVDWRSCAAPGDTPSANSPSCSCGTTIELSIAYHHLSLARKGDVISLHCDVLKLENRLSFQQIEIFNRSNENKHIATGIHVISPNVA